MPFSYFVTFLPSQLQTSFPPLFHSLIVDYKGPTQDVDFPHPLFDRFHHVLIQSFPLLDFLGMRDPAALSSPSLRHTKAYLDTG